jgi:hypothetical protein
MGVYSTNPTNHATEFQRNQRRDKVFVVIVIPFVSVETQPNTPVATPWHAAPAG